MMIYQLIPFDTKIVSLRPWLYGNTTLIYFLHLQEKTKWLSIAVSTIPSLTTQSIPSKSFASLQFYLCSY